MNGVEKKISPFLLVSFLRICLGLSWVGRNFSADVCGKVGHRLALNTQAEATKKNPIRPREGA